MKMIYAGLSSNPNVGAHNWRYNCTLNPKCQRRFNIPIRRLNDLQLYFDLPFKPDSYLLTLVDCNGAERPLTPCLYVVGTNPRGWYGIFTGLRVGRFDGGMIDEDGNTLPNIDTQECDFNDDFNDDFEICGQFVPVPVFDIKCFYVKAVFFAGGQEAVFYSNDICIERCDPLGLIEACYNNPTIGTDAFDNNGVYYGFPIGADSFGTESLRYIHKLYVRKHSIIENKTKLSFSIFNNIRVYKTRTEKIFNFQSELIPTFYKNEVVAVLARGNILINGKPYQLADEVDLNINNEDFQGWDMQVPLIEMVNTFFSCTPTDCGSILNAECDNDYNVTVTEGTGQLIISFTGGTLGAGETLHIIIKKSGTVISNQTLSTLVAITIPYDGESCYSIEWQKECTCEVFSAWKKIEYNCGIDLECCEVVINSAETVWFGHSNRNRLIINFTPCEGAANYTVCYRPLGSAIDHRCLTGFESTNVIDILDTVDTIPTSYEGYIITNCMNGKFSAPVNFDMPPQKNIVAQVTVFCPVGPQNNTSLRLTFTAPTPHEVKLLFGYVTQSNAFNPPKLQAHGYDIYTPPAGMEYSTYHYPRYGAPFEVTIPAGTTLIDVPPLIFQEGDTALNPPTNTNAWICHYQNPVVQLYVRLKTPTDYKLSITATNTNPTIATFVV